MKTLKQAFDELDSAVVRLTDIQVDLTRHGSSLTSDARRLIIQIVNVARLRNQDKRISISGTGRQDDALFK